MILSVNGASIRDTHGLVEATAQQTRGWDLTIARAGQMIRSRIDF